MRHAKFFAPGFFAVIEVNTNNHFSAYHSQTLNDIQTNAAKTKHHTNTSGFCLGGINHRTNAGSHTATDVANFVKRCGFVDFGNGNFWQHSKIGKRRRAHIMQNWFAI